MHFCSSNRRNDVSHYSYSEHTKLDDHHPMLKAMAWIVFFDTRTIVAATVALFHREFEINILWSIGWTPWSQSGRPPRRSAETLFPFLVFSLP
jgi:hypothetical protein